MKRLLFPILGGFGIEIVCVGIFLLFPVGSCVAPLPGVVMLYLHYPAFLFSEHVLRLTSDHQHLVVAPVLMAGVWIAALAGLQSLLQRRAQRRSPVNG